ncbi:dTDP-4-dehydrorhamnose reductase [Rippkaea orientalis PCC 8801]|uniref:dTDP-4-dehydrorhamnose reductase n=1 Tax=Rippkaea orientalis (strain PCC 8801 / RF-1) TaxID=41431 RepID=B7JVK3_RIPO1|nr:dTDP-4-dehydrorhamnose reductase [Rippkaea orientalis]ACK64574.1 dTDP-4-dehydrorhamnose reductase [Rippkaea orientalis PCC 8801]
MSKKILVTGIDGQVGQELKKTLNPLGEVIGVNRQTIDLTKPDRLRQLIQEIHPNIIINGAAYTAVDQAEKEPELALAVNGIAPTIIAEEAHKLGAFLLHISTDYVFDGTKNIPYTEEDPTHPLSVYGQSKLAGEQGIQKHSDRYVILRTAWVYGSYGKSNFVKTMLRLGQEREQIRVVSDQIGSPTWAQDIAQTINQLLLTLDLKNTAEIYHFTNSGVASWYDFAVTIFEEAQNIGFPLKVQQVDPITTADYPTPAKRPSSSVLSGQKITATLGKYAPYWRNSLKQMLTQLYQKTP